jgi:tetratricopeptide (TPR) repeat protein
MKTDIQPCPDYLQDLSDYVDGEFADSAERLVAHMSSCSGCHEYTVTLREMSTLNRAAAQQGELHDEALADQVDAGTLFSSITRNLVDEKRAALARLFYEVGKAYVLAGNRALQERRQQSLAVASQPLPIRGTEARARRVLRDAEQLGAAGGRPSGSTLLLKRSRQLFAHGPDRRSAGALTKGRRFLEEALALDEALDEARLYLGFHHAVVGRPDRARVQLRKVYLQGADPVHKLMALQSLGKLHSEGGDYRRAIDCYEEVVKSEEAGRAPGLFPSFLNLAVNYAKAGDADKSVELFASLAGRFEERRDQIRELLARKIGFQAILERNTAFKRDLLARAPALFAA